MTGRNTACAMMLAFFFGLPLYTFAVEITLDKKGWSAVHILAMSRADHVSKEATITDVFPALPVQSATESRGYGPRRSVRVRHRAQPFSGAGTLMGPGQNEFCYHCKELIDRIVEEQLIRFALAGLTN